MRLLFLCIDLQLKSLFLSQSVGLRGPVALGMCVGNRTP